MTNGPLYFIRSKFNGRVLDVEYGSTEVSVLSVCIHPIKRVAQDDAKIIVYTQKGEDCLNQLWYYEDGYFINAKSAKVLDIRGGQMDPEAEIIQYAQKMTEEAANQRWGIDGDGYIYCEAREDLVLDIQGGEDEDGVPVILYHKREGDVASNQRWSLDYYQG